MSIRVETLTGIVDAAPGEVVIGQIRVSNVVDVDLDLQIAVIGLEPGPADAPATSLAAQVAGGETVVINVPVTVPQLLGIGQHAAAFEVSTGRASDRSVLSPFTLSIASVQRVRMSTLPSTIRGRRRAKFVLDLASQEAHPVGFVVDASAPDVRVRFETDSFHLVPGQEAWTRAKIKGPRRLVGEPTQHNIVITARGRASSTTLTTPFVQRPLLASRLRTVMAAAMVITLWVAAIGGALLWQRNRAEEAANAPPTTVIDISEDLNGSGDSGSGDSGSGDGGSGDSGSGDSGSGDSGSGNDGSGAPANDSDTAGQDGSGSATDPNNGAPAPADGSADSPAGGSGDNGSGDNGSGASDPAGNDGPAAGDDPGNAAQPGDDSPAASTAVSTSVTGTVRIDTDSGEPQAEVLEGVVITLRELELGEQPPAQSEAVAFARPAANRSAMKIWSARRTAAPSILGAVRQTEPITDNKTPDGQGIWLFSGVPLQRTYELAFQKPGFQTQSFVIEPSDDGSLVEVDVSLSPGEGAIGGTVNGPPNGLRNAQITLTDGTLSFATTAASGDGGWRIEGLSTPAVYTLSAVLPGYGTVVQQVSLDVSEDKDGINIDMAQGTATISGKVFDPSGPVGGATVTVTGSDVTRTTTTRTEGDIGSFSIPGLDLDPANPQVITVSVELDGFNGESTQRTLRNTNISGVNFLLTSNRLQLSGVVRSSETQNPLPGASIELSTADLKFATQSGTGASAGTFEVGDLPPGDYVIAIGHFEHETTFEAITLKNGEAPAALDITLQKKDPDDLAGRLRGDLTVRVIDPEGDNQAEREVEGAKVELFDVATGAPVLPVLEENPASNEVRYNVPIGTYSVLVTHPDYNTAPRREATVGLNGETIEIEIDKKLKASGRVIDSVSENPITGYEVEVLRLPTEEKIPVTIVDEIWETDESLPVGSYSVKVTQSIGYRVRDQVIDSSLNGPDRFMRFEIRASLTEKLVLSDIRADPFAVVTGRVFRPTVDGGGTVRLAAIDAPSLAVQMDCRGRSPGAESKSGTAMVTDELVIVGAPADALYDTFTFPRETFAEQQLDNATCMIKASAGTAFTESPPIELSNVSVSNGAALTDRIVNIALAKPVTAPFTGTVFWVDPRDTLRTPIPLDGIRIETIGAGALTDFQPNISGPLQNEFEPKPVFADLETLTTGGGSWRLDGQLVGGTVYRLHDVAGNRFADGTILVTIDEDGQRTVEALTGTRVTFEQGGYNIELFPANTGTASGTVRIVSSDSAFSPVTVTGYEPNNDPAGPGAAATRAETVNPVRSNPALPASADFTFNDAAAGTWTVRFEAPDNHKFVIPSPDPATPGTASIDQLVPPGGRYDEFDATLAELAGLQLNVTSTDTSQPIQSDVAVTHTAGPTSTLSTSRDTSPGSTSADWVVRGFDVDIGNTGQSPTGLPTRHEFTVSTPGFDSAAASVTVAYPPNTFPGDVIPPEFVPDDAIDVPIELRAGAKIPVTITIPPHGKLIGRVVGQRTTGQVAALAIEEAGGLAKVVATATGPAPGPNPVVRPATALELCDPAPPNPADGSYCDVTGAFVFSGPPGQYQVTVTHPEFDQDPTPPADTSPGTAGTPGVYRIDNESVNDTRHGSTANDSWTLVERTTSVDVTVYSSLNPNVVRTEDMIYTLTHTSDPTTYPTRTNVDLPANGIIEGLAPLQPYTLRLEAKPGTTLAFPAVTTFFTPRSTEELTRKVEVTAVLAPATSTFTTIVKAVNRFDAPVMLPTGIVVTANFDSDVPAITVVDQAGTNLKPNDAERGAVPTSQTPSTAGDQITYVFGNVPAGNFTVSVTANPVPPGFDALDPSQQSMVMPGGASPAFTYRAQDVTMSVKLTDDRNGGDYPELRWILKTAAGVEIMNGDAAQLDEPTNTLTIPGVPPAIEPYVLSIADDLHVAQDWPIGSIPVHGNNNGTHSVPDGTVTPVANLARVALDLKQNDGAVPHLPLVMLDTTVVFNPVPNAPVPAYDGSGSYVAEFPATTTSSVLVVDNPNYLEDKRTLPITPGRILAVPITLQKLATVDVQLTRTLTADRPISPGTVPGLAVALVASNNTRHENPQPIGTKLRFQVPAGQSYFIEVNADAYDAAFTVELPFGLIPSDQVGIGAILERRAPIPRVVSVELTSPTNPSATARIGTTTQAITAPNKLRFQYPPSSAAAAAMVEGTLTITAPGHRTKVLVIPDQLITVFDASTAGYPQSCGSPCVLLPNVTVTGTAAVPSGQPFTVTTPAIPANLPTTPGAPAVTLPGTTGAGGAYTVGGLGVGPAGEERIWTINFDVIGSGVANVPVTVTPVSPPAAHTVDIPACPPMVSPSCLAPVLVPVTFTVSNSTGGFAGATVTVRDGLGGPVVDSGTVVAANGELTLSVPENIDAHYTVSYTTMGYITPAELAMSFPLTPPATPFPPAPPAVKVRTAPGVATILHRLEGSGSGADPTKGQVELKLCPVPGPCNANNQIVQNAPPGTGTFDFVFLNPPTAGDNYVLTASQPSLSSPSYPVTVGADGAIAEAPFNVVLS